MLQADAALEGVAAVIFDEFHERSLQADLGLALTLDARANLKPALRLLVMSATLDGAAVARLIGDAPLISAPGRSFAVTTHYLPAGPPLLPDAGRGADTPERRVTQLIRRALREAPGDVLAFLPGAREIRRVAAALAAEGAAPHVAVLPLFGDLAAEAQRAALAPAAPGVRKVVLATNIAETSLTIEGVTRRGRLGPGAARALRSGDRHGAPRDAAHLARLRRAAPGARRPHAARGVLPRLGRGCARRARRPTRRRRSSMRTSRRSRWSSPAGARRTRRRCAGSTRRRRRSWPARATCSHAWGRSMRRGASARTGARWRACRCTRAWRTCCSRPARSGSCRSRRSWRRSCPSATCWPGAPARAMRTSARDSSCFGARAPPGSIASRSSAPAAPRATCSARRARRCRRTGALPAMPQAAGLLLAFAYPDRIGRRRAGGEGRYTLTSGRGAAFAAPQSLARAEFIVAVDLDDAEREARILLAAPLTRADLEAHFAAAISRTETVEWNAREEAVSARRTVKLDALVLEEGPLPQVPAEAARAAMLAGVRALGLEALPWDREARELRARLEFVRAQGRQGLARRRAARRSRRASRSGSRPGSRG